MAFPGAGGLCCGRGLACTLDPPARFPVSTAVHTLASTSQPLPHSPLPERFPSVPTVSCAEGSRFSQKKRRTDAVGDIFLAILGDKKELGLEKCCVQGRGCCHQGSELGTHQGSAQTVCTGQGEGLVPGPVLLQPPQKCAPTFPHGLCAALATARGKPCQVLSVEGRGFENESADSLHQGTFCH